MLVKNNFDYLPCDKATVYGSLYLRITSTTIALLMVTACNSPMRDPATGSEPELTDQQTNLAAASPEHEALESCDDPAQELGDELFQLLNETRASARQCGNESWSATTALTINDQLGEAAASHSRDMAEHNFFSHTGSDGRTADSRINDTGYSWSAIGENIAGGQTNAASVIRDWLGSPGHCANIMQSNYTEVGLSCVRNEATDLNWYWTAVFAKPLGD